MDNQTKARQERLNRLSRCDIMEKRMPTKGAREAFNRPAYSGTYAQVNKKEECEDND